MQSQHLGNNRNNMELMESFFRTHSYLVEHTNSPVRRGLMDEIEILEGEGLKSYLRQYCHNYLSRSGI